MASASEVAAASIAVQMEASNVESRIVAGDPVDFSVLDDLVSKLKQTAQPDPKDEPVEAST